MKRLLAIVVFFTYATAVCVAEDWMKRLDDNTYLSQVSIPGSHDSATGEGWTGFLGEMFGPTMGLTQDLNIAQQLDCGVRAFDLRPCVLEDELVINHGILQTKAKLPETLKQLGEFVTGHPTEFVIVVMRHESDGDDNSSKWNNMVKNCLDSEDIRPLLADYKRDITIGELRGKVLVLSRDKYANKPIGGFISGWGHQADYVSGTIKGPVGMSGVLYVQDFFEVMENMTAKLNGIEKLLNYSTNNNVNKIYRHLTVCINCASGYTASASTDGIRDNAVQCNEKIIGYLADEAHAGPTGIIFMDFAGVDTSESYDVKGLELVKSVISNNWRYTPVKKEEVTAITPLCNSQESKSQVSGSKFQVSGSRIQTRRPTIIIERGRKIIK